MKRVLLVSILLLSALMAECGRILVSAPFGSKSHQNSYIPLIKALAERGHHVTLITNYGVKDLRPLTNVEQIELDSLKINSAMFGDAFEKAMGDSGSMYNRLQTLASTLTKIDAMATHVARTVYSNPQILHLIKNGRFDFVLVSQFFSATSYPLAWHFNATLAMYNPVS